MATSSISSALQHTTLNDHEEVLKIANSALKKSKRDVNAQHLRLVALLKLDRYDDAWRVLEEGGDSLKKQARLEWAYTLYKKGGLEEAEHVAGDGDGARGLKHLEAQAAYRSENFERAAELYADLYNQKVAQDSDSDIRINSGAAAAQLAWTKTGQLSGKTKIDRLDLEQFETAYNAACGCIARGELKQADILLSRARDLCTAAEELSEDDKISELLPITAQQVYLFRRLGKVDEALKLSSGLDLSHISDPVTRHVAQVNHLVVSPASSNVFLSHRLFHSSQATSRTDMPFKYQQSVLQHNSLVLDLRTGKTTGVAASTLSKMASTPNNISAETASAGVINAAAHCQNHPGKAALKQVLPLLEHRPSDVGLLLTVLQLYVSTNNASTATALLESFFARLENSTAPADGDVRFAPGLTATIVSLYNQQGRTAHTKAELAKAAKYWRHKSKVTPSLTLLFKAAGTALLRASTPEEMQEAHDIFTFVNRHDPNDHTAIAGMLASSNVMAVHEYPPSLVEKLPLISKLVQSIDTAALEAAGVAQPDAKPDLEATSRKRPAPDSAQPKATKAKKIRKSRMPKDYDPSKTPDPERWLPLRDRTSWKPKGKKKGKGGGMQTQGGIVSEESTRPSTPSQQQQQPKLSAGGVLKAKSKKKGKK